MKPLMQGSSFICHPYMSSRSTGVVLIPEYIHANHNWTKVSCIRHFDYGTPCHLRQERHHLLSVLNTGWRLSVPDMLYNLNQMSLFLDDKHFLLLGWALDGWFCFTHLRAHSCGIERIESICDFISFQIQQFVFQTYYIIIYTLWWIHWVP